MTVGEYLTGEWLPAVASTLRPLSVTRYRAVVRRYITPSVGSARLQALQLRDLARY